MVGRVKMGDRKNRFMEIKSLSKILFLSFFYRIDIELPKPQVSKPTEVPNEITVPTENTTTTPEPVSILFF